MKNQILLVISFLISGIIFSQDIPQLKLTKTGVAPIELEFEKLNSTDIYNKTMLWVQETFKNPKDALKENLINEKIKLQGFQHNAWWYKSMGIKNVNHMQYTVQINIKNNNVLFEYTVGEFYIFEGPEAQYDYRMFFKKDGSTRKQYVDAVTSLELTMNKLLVSYYNYISGKSVQVEHTDLNKYLTTLQNSLSNDSKNPETNFDLACFYSLIEDKNNAFSYLHSAVANGYKNWNNIKTNPDLKWLRSQDEFKEFTDNNYELPANYKTTPKIDYIQELKELALLKDKGIINEKEFNELKEKIIERAKKD
ncbi:SHOCT domain-containing protein [Lutibacter holmesii]|uniref:SHOCT domain-containing protein n=1 Tax=Lutibacter holmesii TaxID=1137985 RepID=A0ABW3WR52_9FLAO